MDVFFIAESTKLILNPLSLDASSVIIARQIPAPQVTACPCEAVGTSFAAPHVSGVVARIMQLGLATATGDGTEVEEIRTLIRGMADRRESIDQDPPGLDYASLDQPITGSGYTYDGEREGVVQAPYPSP